MSDPVQRDGLPQPKQDPEALVLRGRPPRTVRFRKGMIVGITGAVAAGLVALSWSALQPPALRKAATAVGGEEPASRTDPDALRGLPSSYGEVPHLGPPLPGDLGRPILERQRGLGAAQPSIGEPSPEQPVAAGRERAAAALQAARSSPVLVQLEGGQGPGVPPADRVPPTGSAAAAAGPSVAPASAAGQPRKIEFARSAGVVQPSRELRPPSPWTLSAGTMIPASLITGLNSDLPGLVVAQVSENVRDSATGRTVLIPQGARLLGRYDSMIAFGQRRALLVWTRLLFPNGASLELDKMPATDPEGYAGLEDRVDSHGWQLIKGIGLSTLLGISTQLAVGGRNALVRAIRESAQQNAAEAGAQLASRNLDVQPTIKVRPGWPVRLLLDRDLVLQPWSE
jgi:type IV secretion system protein VirB10